MSKQNITTTGGSLSTIVSRNLVADFLIHSFTCKHIVAPAVLGCGRRHTEGSLYLYMGGDGYGTLDLGSWEVVTETTGMGRGSPEHIKRGENAKLSMGH